MFQNYSWYLKLIFTDRLQEVEQRPKRDFDVMSWHNLEFGRLSRNCGLEAVREVITSKCETKPPLINLIYTVYTQHNDKQHTGRKNPFFKNIAT